MSINVGQVFVRTDDRPALLKQVQDTMQAWVKQGCFNPEKSNLVADGERRVLVLPPVRGWHTILESQSRSADVGLAQAVARLLKTRTVVLEFAGCVFNYTYAQFDCDSRPFGEALLTDKDEQALLLPVFKDAEQLMWEQALVLGLPPETLLLRAYYFTPGEPTGTPALEFRVFRDGPGVRLQAFERHLNMPLAQKSPPVRFDLALVDSAGQPRVILESRFLWGAPVPERVEHLSMLLRRIQARYAQGSGVPASEIRFQVMAGKQFSEVVPLPADLASVSNPPRPSRTRKPFE